jgi:glutamate dehydrogenase/leucine dehydrogenase
MKSHSLCQYNLQKIGNNVAVLSVKLLTKSMQTHPEENEVVMLGSGESGKYIALTQAKNGMRTIVAAIRRSRANFNGQTGFRVGERWFYAKF